jgi:DeoR family deoxyribose operon repressor
MGGLYHSSSASLSGEDGLATLRRVRLNKAFISAGGVHPSRGVSCSNFHEVPAKRAVIENALGAYLVVDSGKFGKVTPAHFADLCDFAGVISEGGLNSADGVAQRTVRADG